IVVTGSDDHLWKMWALPDGNIIVTGEGHTDWLWGCCFHPRSNIAYILSVGISTLTVPQERNQNCYQFFYYIKNTIALWWIFFRFCCYWKTGGFISILQDQSGKEKSITSERCRYMCGHKDSVNSVEFLLFSNTVLTSSADKTSLWDART
ncbi:Sperm-associated antigen 16 protein, partial [Apaloderma vittatum]